MVEIQKTSCNAKVDNIVSKNPWLRNLKGYALCRRPPLSGRGLCGGGYVVLAHLPCWVYWLLVVLSVLVFLWNVLKQVVFWRSFLWFFHLWLLLGTRFLSLWMSKTYRLTGLVPPFSYAEDHFATLGTPERTMEGPMWAQDQIFHDFGWFGDPILKAF